MPKTLSFNEINISSSSNFGFVDTCSLCQPDKERIIYESKNFFVLASLGPIVEGYLVVFSKPHYSCFGSFPAELLVEFRELQILISSVFFKAYGKKAIFFEHGQVKSCLQKVPHEEHCYHAHMHAVPGDCDLLPKISKRLEPFSLSKIESLKDFFLQFDHYLYFENSQKHRYAFYVNKDLPRQFLRLILAKKLDTPKKADWVKYPEREKVKRAIKKLKPLFDRIKGDF